jgi:diguanylate cyclase (GGDEF)-like protein
MSSQLPILVCDHRGEGLSQRLEPLSAAGFSIEVSEHVRATRERLAELHPAVIVLDPLAEGGRAEIEDIERLHGGDVPIALLLVFDPADPEPALRSARSVKSDRVALDLIHRGASTNEFRLRIERLCEHAKHHGEVRDLRHRAMHDDRTDLLRPNAFQQRLAEHFSAAERHQLDLALVLIDLDDFGRVNKVFDHTKGDLVIAKVGEAIRAALRTEDVAGRIGGDEFAVMLPYTRGIEAAHVVNRLRDAIQALTSGLIGAGGAVSISASLGFETIGGGDIDSLDTLRRHAEIALREAKRQGGNRGVYYRSLDDRNAGDAV